MEHTPGPWHVNVAGNERHHSVRTEDGTVIALTGNDGANADLIAAAPALLEALEEAARLYHEAKCFILGEVDRERFPSYLECPYWPCVDARAAIKQAKGTP